jgi:hypothetical protein
MTAATLIRHIDARDDARVNVLGATWTRQEPLALTGKLYRFHGMPVVDVNGETVGQIDWIWSDDTSGRGTHLGVQLRWLRGTARAVPAGDLLLDPRTSTIQVAYRKDQIKRAPRFAIDRSLSADHQRAISAHYSEPAVAVAGPTLAA